MTLQRAREIIAALADGIDPETGEVLTDKGILNSPEVIRALFTALRALE